MPRRITLSRSTLRYADKLVLHTASSGIVPGLDELRLVIEQDGAIAGVGASRINIRYLNGLDADELAADAAALCGRLCWREEPAALVDACDVAAPPAPLRMLVEMAVRDAQARIRDIPLAALFGGVAEPHSHTNQTLFWCDDATLLVRARGYLARGFTDLKLRVGIGSVEDDVRRLAALRALAPQATLSADANGQWTVAEAQHFLAAARPLRLASLEQPLAKGERAGLTALEGVPLMLDEDMEGEEDIAWLENSRAVPLAHLKLAKLGGVDRLVAAGRRLQAAGIGVMVGQMNEGVPSTLAAAHAAMALGVSMRELYGADGLADDPCGTLRYADGRLHLRTGPGLGLVAPCPSGDILWEGTA
jgi:L-alanine-DL-glutamate epimerase-like enolase superfamily enzyme